MGAITYVCPNPNDGLTSLHKEGLKHIEKIVGPIGSNASWSVQAQICL